ncbi:hypothetical protein LCGC14_2677980 [marine sediment metagenome]|uniref:Uncharacterized protein n=1 Tax=marine sediment metagenome TaxID=412755 RepID=A0A0F9CE10_9ZZZZ
MKPFKCPKCNKDTYCKRLCKDCTPKKKGRGSVGRMWRKYIRRKEDKEYRKKENRNTRKYQLKNKEYYQTYAKKRGKILNEFKNNRCEICGKLLNHKTKSSLCRSHSRREYVILLRKYKSHREASKEFRRRYWD